MSACRRTRSRPSHTRGRWVEHINRNLLYNRKTVKLDLVTYESVRPNTLMTALSAFPICFQRRLSTDITYVVTHNREFKIRRLRTTATDKYATALDQNHVTVHFSRVVLRQRWVVELFRVVGTTENVLLVFCRLGNSRISSFRKNVFNSPALSEREAKYVSCV